MEMSCYEVQKCLEEYVNGTLSVTHCIRIEQHLRQCAFCRQLVQEMRLLKSVLQKTSSPLPPPCLAEKIKIAAQTRLAYKNRPLPEKALGSPAFLATCVSLLCGALIGLLVMWKMSFAPNISESGPAPVVDVVAAYHLRARDIETIPQKNKSFHNVKVRRQNSSAVSSQKQNIHAPVPSLGPKPASNAMKRHAKAIAPPLTHDASSLPSSAFLLAAEKKPGLAVPQAAQNAMPAVKTLSTQNPTPFSPAPVPRLNPPALSCFASSYSGMQIIPLVVLSPPPFPPHTDIGANRPAMATETASSQTDTAYRSWCLRSLTEPLPEGDISRKNLSVSAKSAAEHTQLH